MQSSPLRSRRALWIAAGILLRLAFIAFARPGYWGDTAGYLELGHNLFHHGVYGLADNGSFAPSLYRLPGYPLFLATMELLFAKIWPGSWINAVFLVQAAADLAGGLLLASLARRQFSPRSAEIVLALAMLCPFTAAYAAIALTESLSVFAVSLGVYAAGRALLAAQAGGRHRWALGRALVLAGCAAALAMLLRPDGVLLFAALAAGLFWYTARCARGPWTHRLKAGAASAALYCLVALVPLAPWTLRNWRAFHVFQPLSSRYQNDPGETPSVGFYRWALTWSYEYTSTLDSLCCIGESQIDINLLPARAFDSPQQRELTARLLAQYNGELSIAPELDARFAALAAERIRAHPLRFYLVLPVLRVADMAFRPRTEAFYLDAYWWRFGRHPGQTLIAVLLGLINLASMALAAWAFLRRRVPWPWMLGGYILARCLMLTTMYYAEQRYTLEFFPIVFIAAALAFSEMPRAGSEAMRA